MAIQNYSVVLFQEKPEFRINIPFKSSRRVAEETFSRMAFCFNCSPFDKIYLFEFNYLGTRSIMVNMAYLKGVYDE